MTAKKILVIRRDNIGDLVCTTPLLRALRGQMPNARIECLVTSYNEQVLAGNPDVDIVHAYTKAKHRNPGESVFSIYRKRLALILELRAKRFDYLLLPGGAQASSQRFAKWVAPKQLLLRDEQDESAGSHEVQQCCNLLTRLGLEFETPSPLVVPRLTEVERLRKQLGHSAPLRVIGLHISARKISQRWPAERFAELAREFNDGRTVFILLWAPGRQDDPLHPGDDEKARQIVEMNPDLPIKPITTKSLSELIDALALCDVLVCGDGGAMHVAAGLGKPIVCLFGQSDSSHWHPWGIEFELLQPESRNVQDVVVSEVATSLKRLAARL